MTLIEKYILDILLNGKSGGINVRILLTESFDDDYKQTSDITKELKEIVTKSLELKENENESNNEKY